MIILEIPGPPITSGTDKLIMLVATLFVLSMVCERIANLLKMLLSDLEVKSKQLIGNMSIRETDTRDEKKRERRVLVLNLCCGFFTALVLQANLISILQDPGNTTSHIGWSNFHLIDLGIGIQWLNVSLGVLCAVLGWFFTGCFISMGSKFWHDMLDLLFEIKNAKSLTNAENIRKTARLDFDELGSTEQKQVINAAITAQGRGWRNKYSGIKGIKCDTKITNGLPTGKNSIVFTVAKGAKSGKIKYPVEKEILYLNYRIPTDIIEADIPKSSAMADCTYSGAADTPRKPGASISRINSNNSGTLSLKVSRTDINNHKTFYLLSCAHVLFVDEMTATQPDITQSDANLSPSDPATAGVICPGNFCLDKGMDKTLIGTATEGVFGTSMDAGIATLTQNISTDIATLAVPSNVYSPGPADQNVLQLNGMGMRSGALSGTLLNYNANTDVAYPELNYTPYMESLYEVQMTSLDGDSGAAILDSSNRVIGILIASVGNLTYVLPIQFIENALNIDVETT